MPTGVYKRTPKDWEHGDSGYYGHDCRCDVCSEAMRERGRKARERTKWIAAYKESHPCMDCGGYFLAECMDFDHRPDEERERDISRMGHYSSDELILAEIAKCDLICANCHRTRTHRRRYG